MYFWRRATCIERIINNNTFENLSMQHLTIVDYKNEQLDDICTVFSNSALEPYLLIIRQTDHDIKKYEKSKTY